MVTVASGGRGVAKAIGMGAIGHAGICSGSSVTKAVGSRCGTVTVASGSRSVAKAVCARVVCHAAICTSGCITEAISVGG